MSDTSTCPEVRSWLLAELALRLPDAVRLSRARPVTQDISGEHVWLGDSVGATSEPHGLGPSTLTRSSTYSTDVIFRCSAKSDGGAAEAAVFSRLAQLELLLAETPKPDIAGLVGVTLTGWQFVSDGPDGPPVVTITAAVAAAEHLT